MRRTAVRYKIDRWILAAVLITFAYVIAQVIRWVM